MAEENKGAAGAAGAAAGAAAGDAGAAGAGSAMGAASGAAAAAGAAAGAAGAADQFHGIPEKYRVNGADGKFDHAASTKKLAGGYGELATRMKDGGLPPESPDKYEFAAVEDADKELMTEIMGEDGTKEFIKAAHAAGYTSAQINVALKHQLEVTKAVADALGGETREACMTGLKEHYKTDKAVGEALGRGFRAVNAFAAQMGVDFKAFESAGLANNPLFCRLMDKIGAQMGEDVSANDVSGGGAGKSFDDQVEEIDVQLRTLDLNDPKRKDLQERKMKLFERKHPATQPLIRGAA